MIMIQNIQKMSVNKYKPKLILSILSNQSLSDILFFPWFSGIQDQQNIKTSENEQIGTVIGKVSAANDIDSPEFSKNYYFLACQYIFCDLSPKSFRNQVFPDVGFNNYAM